MRLVASRLSGSSSLTQHYQEGPGDPAPSSGFGECTCLHRRLQASKTRRCAWGLTRSLGPGGLPTPSEPLRKEGVPPVLAKGFPAEGPHAGPGGAQRFSRPCPQRRRRRDAAAAWGHRGRQAAGLPAGTSSRPRPAPARCAAASRGGRQHGACALARSRPWPVGSPGRAGGGNVGRRRAAHPPGPPPAPPTPRGEGAPRRPSNERRR